MQQRYFCRWPAGLMAACALLLGLAWPLPAAQLMDTSRSESGQYVVISRDRLLNQNLLDLAVGVRDQLEEKLGLSRNWRHLVRLVPFEAQNEQLRQFPTLKAFLDQGKLSFEVHFPTNTPYALEEFLRTLVYTFLYEAVLHDRETFDDGEPLPVIPMWLAEGVLQQLENGHARQWHKIVHRGVTLNKVPSLSDVLSWNTLSGDPLMRGWQQAFSHQLVNYMTDADRREDFVDWIRRQGSAKQEEAFVSLRPFLANEIDWRQVLSLARDQQSRMIYNFDETAARFAALQSIRIPAAKTEKNGEDRIVKLSQLAPYAKHPQLEKLLNDKVEELLQLELRAHFSWRPVLAWYRAGLIRLSAGDLDDYGKAMEKGETELRTLSRFNEQVTDYFNWFIVSKAASSSQTEFEDYYRVRDELEGFTPPVFDPLRSEGLRIQRRK